MSSRPIKKEIMLLITALCLCGAFYFAYLLILEGLKDDHIFFLSLLLLFPLALKFFLDYRLLYSKEKNFPVFVQDLALNIKTGMQPVKAIILLKDNDYGALSSDVKLLASNLNLGTPVDKALEAMAGNIKSTRIKRAISMISGAIRAGGRIEEVLTILSAYLINDREKKSEIDSKLFTYQLILYIVFIIYIAMNYFLLNNIFPIMKTSGFSVDESFYRALMFRSTLLLGVFMGITGGKLTKGSIAAGVPSVFLLLTIGYILHKTIL